MSDQQLFLDLSSGLVPSTRIRAVNLDTYHLARCSSAVAVWLRDQSEPLYFAHGTPDAEAVKAWAETQLGEQFLSLPGSIGCDEMTHYFAQDLVELADVDTDGGVYVKLKGDPRFWWFSPRSWAASALLAWAADGQPTAPRVVALAAAS